MGMLDLFREWLDRKSRYLHSRRRTAIITVETLEKRRVLSPMLVGTTLTVDGTAGADTVSVTQDATGVTVVLNGVITTYGPGTPINTINVNGLAGNDQITMNNLFASTAANVDGGADTNTLIVPSQANSWIISGSNSGTFNGDNFSNIQNLTGGGFNDNFRFNMNGFISGSVDGDAGLNTLDYSTRNLGAVVDLGNATATGVGSHIFNITDFHGSADNTDQLIGTNLITEWDITGGDAGNLDNSFFFSGVENLTGGSSADHFLMEPTGFVEGVITGGAGPNSLDYSNRTTPVLTNLQLSVSTAIGSSFNQIGTIVGSSSTNDRLVGINQTNNWNITGPNAGTVVSVFNTTSFTGYENLTGGTASDSFNFNDNGFVSGPVSGGGGIDTLNYSSRSSGIVANLQTSSSTAIGGGYSSIENFVGSSSATDLLIGLNTSNTFNITGANAGDVNGLVTFSSIENLNGGIQDDTFNVVMKGFIGGLIDGGLGTNTIDYSNRHNFTGAAVIVNLNTKSATAIGSYLHISNFVGTPKPGGSGLVEPDTIIGANVQNLWNITSLDAGTVANNQDGQTTFSDFENVTGGTNIDIFRISPNGGLSGVLNGGNFAAGTSPGDWVDYSLFSTPVIVNLTTGVGTGLRSIVNVRNVHGGDGGNTITGNSLGNILVGGAGADKLIAGNNRSILIGGLGADTVTGGNDQDILIGGYTDFDQNFAALASIFAEWRSASSFNTRVNHLRNGGGLNGLNELVADITVHNDVAPDVIRGNAGPNWLWGQPAELKDVKSTDLVDTPIHNPPTLAGTSSVIFNIQRFPVVIDPNIVVSSTTNKTLASATVKIGQNFDPTQDNLAFSPSKATGNIVSSYDITTGTLTLTSAGATATVAQWQLALRSVVYYNPKATPTTGPRLIAFQVFDGTSFSNSVGSQVLFNYPPVLSGTSTLIYHTLQAPTAINTNVVITDKDNQRLAFATVTISTLYQPNQDVLSFVGDATTGDIVASFNSTTGVLTLTAAGPAASVAQYQAALRKVAYSDTAAFPLQQNRTVTFQVSDGNATSNTTQSTIRLVN